MKFPIQRNVIVAYLRLVVLNDQRFAQYILKGVSKTPRLPCTKNTI